MLNAVLSPHLDDAVLSCWRLLDGPDEAVVVNVFTASPPVGTPAPWWDRATGAADPVERMRERRKEDAGALALVGRPSIPLGLLDDQYRHAEIALRDLVERIRLAVDSDARFYAPAAFGRHPDHVLVREAALELARLGRSVTLYADLPHATVRAWPAWVSGERTAIAREVAADWDRVLTEAGLVREKLVRRVHPIEAGARARKLTALAVYQTQRAALDRASFVPLDEPRALAWEVTWEVRPSALRRGKELSGEPLIADVPRELGDDGL
jgi:LmbE family N-acetylglucosaminyl deacetylase